jgi:hypothetical protein
VDQPIVTDLDAMVGLVLVQVTDSRRDGQKSLAG